jgi:chromosome segregation ATPase
MLTGLAGCGSSEREKLAARVDGLEQELAEAKSGLGDRDAKLNELGRQLQSAEQALKQAQANIDVLTGELVAVKAERDQLTAQLEAAQAQKK